MDIPAEDVVEILRKLSFGVARDGDTLTVTVPAYRVDVDGEADLCEVALRMYGYDHIGCTRLRGETTQGGITPMLKLKNRVATALKARGCLEVMNYSFLSRKQLEQLGLPEGDPRLDPMVIRNPLGEDTAVMRPTLVPGMLRTLSFNLSHGVEKAGLYEMAAVFDHHRPTDEGLPTETQMLGVGLYGDDVDFYALRGALEVILRAEGVRYELVPGADAYYHPGRSARLMLGDTLLAQLGEVHPATREAFGLPKRALVAELNLDLLLERSTPMGELKPLPRFPSVARDLALTMDETVAVGPLMAAMKKAAGNLLESIRMFDVYRGAQVGLGRKSAAFSLVFRAPDRTLTDADIAKAMEKVQRACDEQFDARVR